MRKIIVVIIFPLLFSCGQSPCEKSIGEWTSEDNEFEMKITSNGGETYALSFKSIEHEGGGVRVGLSSKEFSEPEIFDCAKSYLKDIKTGKMHVVYIKDGEYLETTDEDHRGSKKYYKKGTKRNEKESKLSPNSDSINNSLAIIFMEAEAGIHKCEDIIKNIEACKAAGTNVAIFSVEIEMLKTRHNDFKEKVKRLKPIENYLSNDQKEKMEHLSIQYESVVNKLKL